MEFTITTETPTANVTISLAQYKQLMRDSEKLMCLENAGVDNWEGYDWAMENYEGEEDSDD